MNKKKTKDLKEFRLLVDKAEDICAAVLEKRARILSFGTLMHPDDRDSSSESDAEDEKYLKDDYMSEKQNLKRILRKINEFCEKTDILKISKIDTFVNHFINLLETVCDQESL